MDEYRPLAPRPLVAGGPVDNRLSGTHRRKPAWTQGFRPSSPSSTLPMYYDERFKREMMETDIAVGAGVRVTVSRDDLSSRLALVSRATSTRGTVQVLGGILLRASDGLVELEATDMELSLRTTVPAEVEGEGVARDPCAAPRRHREAAARRERDARVPARGRGRIDRVGLVLLPRQRLRRRGLPAAAVDRRPAPGGRRRVAARDRPARLARRFAGRVAAGADRDPRASSRARS